MIADHDLAGRPTQGFQGGAAKGFTISFSMGMVGLPAELQDRLAHHCGVAARGQGGAKAHRDPAAQARRRLDRAATHPGTVQTIEIDRNDRDSGAFGDLADAAAEGVGLAAPGELAFREDQHDFAGLGSGGGDFDGMDQGPAAFRGIDRDGSCGPDEKAEHGQAGERGMDEEAAGPGMTRHQGEPVGVAEVVAGDHAAAGGRDMFESADVEVPNHAGQRCHQPRCELDAEHPHADQREPQREHANEGVGFP